MQECEGTIVTLDTCADGNVLTRDAAVAMMSQYRERTGNRAAWSLYNPEGGFACFVEADMAEPPQEGSEESLVFTLDTRVSYTLNAAGAKAWNQNRRLGIPSLVAGHIYTDSLQNVLEVLGPALVIGDCLTEDNTISLHRDNILDVRRLNINWNAQVEFQLTKAGVVAWRSHEGYPPLLPYVTYREALWEVAHALGKHMFSEVLVDGQLTCKVRSRGQWWEAV